MTDKRTNKWTDFPLIDSTPERGRVKTSPIYYILAMTVPFLNYRRLYFQIETFWFVMKVHMHVIGYIKMGQFNIFRKKYFMFAIWLCKQISQFYLWSQIFRAITGVTTGCFMGRRLIEPAHTQRCEKWWTRWARSCYFFAPAVLIFGLCTRTGCALVLIFGSSCANVWPKQFGQLTQLCLVSGDYRFALC